MFSSMRSNSSRQLVGCTGEDTKELPTFAVGIRAFSSRVPLILTGTVLPGNGLAVPGIWGQLEPGQTSEKLPARSAAVGTWALKFWPGTRSLRHSCDQKKKVLSLPVLY